jgi:solute carrier family 39 (zinc transporter), member 1/2/3
MVTMLLASDLTQLTQRQIDTSTPTCDTGNDYNGRIGLRVAAIFIIWATSSIGAAFPIFAKRNKGMRVPEWTFFIAKYFGSGVIVATAFIHLLGPAEDALRNPCLTGPITEYSWAEGIILMTIFSLFFVELMVMRYGNFDRDHGHSHDHNHQQELIDSLTSDTTSSTLKTRMTTTSMVPSYIEARSQSQSRSRSRSQSSTHAPGEDHLSHARTHTDIEAKSGGLLEDYRAQMTAIFILEFGIIFHSVFIGLTLAVAGQEFDTLFVVLIFHQTFEGLGLGSRLAITPWPQARKYTPYIMALAFGLSTPLAIAIGLGVKNTYPPGGKTTLIVNGVFDSISAGILIYTGLVELMAHEFMFSESMRTASIRLVLAAFGLMCLGAAIMALLGKWA